MQLLAAVRSAVLTAVPVGGMVRAVHQERDECGARGDAIEGE